MWIIYTDTEKILQESNIKTVVQYAWLFSPLIFINNGNGKERERREKNLGPNHTNGN